jgi:hypothetical protein
MFILNNQPLSPDRAFTTEDGTQYPSNWLRLATVEEREAIGITETPDPIPVDQRFYWDTGIPKDHTQLVEQWTAQIKQTAGSLLAQTDWYITRASETGLAAPQSVLERRSLIRAMSNDKEGFLSLTETTEQLAEYVTSAGFNNWESGASIDGAIPVIDNVTSGTVITGDTLFGGSGNDTLIFN